MRIRSLNVKNLKRKLEKYKYILVLFILCSFISLFHIKTEPIYKTITPVRQDISETIEVSGNVYPKQLSIVNLPESKKIKKLTVKVGDYVKKGQIVAYLDDSAAQENYKNALNAYYAAINSARKAQALSKQVEQSQKHANSQYTVISNIFNSLGTLVPEDKQDEYNALKSSLNTTLTSLHTTQASLYSQLSQLNPGQSAINMAYAQVQMAKRAIEATKIRSPISGVVLEAMVNNFDVNANAGMGGSLGSTNISSLMLRGTNNLSALSEFGTTFGASSSDKNGLRENKIVIANNDKWYIIAYVTQQDWTKIRPNLKANLHIEGIDKVINGKVCCKHYMPKSLTDENPVYPVSIYFSVPKTVQVAPGMHVIGKIIIKTANNALVVPLSQVEIRNKQRGYIMVLENNKPVQKQVEVGIKTYENVQITKGVDKNTKIIVKQTGVRRYLEFKPLWFLK